MNGRGKTAWLLVLLVLAPLVLAETYYYDPRRLRPTDIYFNPTPEEMECAAMLNPGTAGQVTVNLGNLRAQLSCPAQPPVVVWGEDSNGNAIYAIGTIKVRFYGPGTYDGEYGTDTLMELLKSDYLLRLLVSGDLGEADIQYESPVRKPRITSPVSDSPNWHTWSSDERIEIDDARIIRKRNLGPNNRHCRVYNDRCWRADFIWSLPVRLVLHGGETGSPEMTVEFPSYPEDVFVSRTNQKAATQGISGGKLITFELRPIDPTDINP